MEKKIIKIEATLESIRTMKDRTLKLIFESQEIAAAQGSSILSMCNEFGWLIFASEPIEEIEIPEDSPTGGRRDKTPSQRLRGVLYRYWEQHGNTEDFELYYRETLERLIEHYRSKLD